MTPIDFQAYLSNYIFYLNPYDYQNFLNTVSSNIFPSDLVTIGNSFRINKESDLPPFLHTLD